jgi:ESCRT-II complex subunit VPS36
LRLHSPIVIPSTSTDCRSTQSDGILRTVETSAQSTATDMSNALQDLEALMIKAKDMVSLAADLNERLTAATAATTTLSSSPSITPSTSLLTVGLSEPEEATFIRSSLSQLGLQMTNTPVTHDMMKDEQRWTNELARELARVLQGTGNEPRKSGGSDGGGMMKDRGIIALDEVWGGWNRARGVGMSSIVIFKKISH